MNKGELIQSIRRARAELEVVWEGATEEQMTRRPGPQADWSVKDLVAHLVYWEQWIVYAIQRGLTPPCDEADAANARVFEENRDRPLADLLADFRRSLEQVVAQVQTLSDEDLASRYRFAWQKNRPLWDFIAGETIDHYREHLTGLHAWRQSLEAMWPA